MYPPIGNAFIVQQDENDVQQDHKHGKEAKEDIDGFGQQPPDPWQGCFQGGQYVTAVQDFRQLLDVDMFTQKFGQLQRDSAAPVAVREIFYQQIFQAGKFLNHGRHQQIESQSAHQQDGPEEVPPLSWPC